MKLFNVGTTEIGEYQLGIFDGTPYQWLVADYETGNYEGSGWAVALREDGMLDVGTLGHCSCWGPLDNWPETSLTPAEFFATAANIHDTDYSPQLRAKVAELLGLPDEAAHAAEDQQAAEALGDD